MHSLPTASNIEKILEKTLLSQVSNWKSQLCNGDLFGYEASLRQSLDRVYNMLSEELLRESAALVSNQLKEACQASEGSKIELRPLSFRIATGHRIQVASPYVKEVRSDWEGTRHLLATHWQVIGGASPGLLDKVGYCSALGPSYSLAHQTLSRFGVDLPLSSVRQLTNHLASYCFDQGEENIGLEAAETLAGKRVVISVDGGRTRTRSYDGNTNEAGHLTYETSWREPKLFVIDLLDDQGKSDRYELPIYGCRFSDTDMLELLRAYLKKLRIDQAKEVQILADGAPWIWNNLKPLLIELKVDPNKITETLDYYHASQYVHQLVDKMPKRVSQRQRQTYLKQFKEWLWQGKSTEIVKECRNVYKRPNALVKRGINYLDKHQNKTQYTQYQQDKLMCGSGIIESGIRRVINLRFKNASTFWKVEKVEKLYFLRAAMLTKRWDILMKNITNSS